MAEWDRRFAVAISLELSTGKWSVGSGYAIAPHLVLTARHVVTRADAKPGATPRVHLVNLGGKEHEARVRWPLGDADPKTTPDLALLEIDEVIDERLSPWSILASDPLRDASDWQAEGFPRAAITSDDPLKPAAFEGRVQPAVPGRPMLDLDGVVAPRLSDGWHGMSGAAVFVRGGLVGVIGRLAPDAIANRPLQATPIAPSLEDEGLRTILDEASGRARLARLERDMTRVVKEHPAAQVELAALLGIAPGTTAQEISRKLITNLRADVVVITLAKAAIRSTESAARGVGDPREPFRVLLDMVLPQCVDWDEINRTHERRLRSGNHSSAPIDLPVATCAIAEALIARARGVHADLVLSGSVIMGRTGLRMSRRVGIDEAGFVTSQQVVDHLVDELGVAPPSSDEVDEMLLGAIEWGERVDPASVPYVLVASDCLDGVAEQLKKRLPALLVLRLVPDREKLRVEGGLESTIRKLF